MRTTRRRHTLVVVAACLPLLAACSGAAESASEPSVTPTPSAEPSPTVPPEVACLEGTWVLDAARQAASLAEGMRLQNPAAEATAAGETTYTFADGVLTRTFTGVEEWFMVTPAVAPDVRWETTTSVEGSATSPFTATSTHVETQEGDATQVTVTVASLENGVPQPTQGDPQAEKQASLSEPSRFAYVCDGDTLRLAEQWQEGDEPDASSETAMLLTRR